MNSFKNLCHDCHEMLNIPKSKNWSEIRRGSETCFQLCKKCYDKRVNWIKTKSKVKSLIIPFFIILSAVLIMIGSMESN